MNNNILHKKFYLFCTNDNYSFCVRAYSLCEAENIAQKHFNVCKQNNYISTSIYNNLTFLKEVSEDYVKYGDLIII